MKDWKKGIHVTPKSEMRSVTKKGEKTRSYQRLQRSQFVKLFSAGFSRDDITELMELKPNEYDKLFHDMYQATEQELGLKSTHRAYTEYVIGQTKLLRDLEQFKGILSKEDGSGLSGKVTQSYLGALKTQSDIVHKILLTGVQLGVLTKEGNKTMRVGGVDPRDMDASQLGDTLAEELTKAQKLASKGRKKGAEIYVINPEPKKAASE